MKDDLNDIDLIDLYLTGELNEAQQQIFKDRYLNDAEFKKEVEVYRKIFEGIEQASSDDLKKKLDGYYDEFVLDETELIDENSNVRSINWRRTLYAVSGIAASICLFAIAYWAFVIRPANEIKAGKEGYAHRGHQIKPRIIPIDTGHSGDYTDHPYALAGQIPLDDTAIRQATYPQPLSYTFNNGLLTIYGDPLLGMLKLKVFKKDNQYLLVYDNQTYGFSAASKITPFLKDKLTISDEGTPSKETIQVSIAALPTTIDKDSPPYVTLTPGNDTPAYHYSKIKGKTQLVLQGFRRGNCLLVKLKSSDSTAWYMVRGESVYRLGKEMDKTVIMHQLSGMAEPEARMFTKRGPFTQPVLSFKQ